MRQNSDGRVRNMISMEEYLKRRQALRKQDPGKRAGLSEEEASALKLAGILFV
ncbi:hypothetical protein [Lachnoclostridium sp. An169]|uniref:hypothetical protein n=1 Tax=Lachnoclostridium sp. An169 TaxID=1965569 RepID=UPI0013A607F0|nr:hypothetical protein [Lachnoclostridium sp. An169]HJA67877.1 hypothetical protein [Candidatus Mediterraneibacter cottocaccae]